MSALLQRVPPRDALGRIFRTNGVAAPAHVHNGIPYTSAGTLAVDATNSIDHYHQGLPFTAAGRLCMSPTGLPTRVAPGCAPYQGTERLALDTSFPAHYVHGVAFTGNENITTVGA